MTEQPQSEVWRSVWVEIMPPQLRPKEIYISIKYRTVCHLCPCGCGNEICVPIGEGKEEWQLKVDGDEITLSPSLFWRGSPCRSHYSIRRNRIIWHR